MSAEQNKELVLDFFKRAFVDHDLDSAAALMAGDFRFHDPMWPDFQGGAEAYKRAQQTYLDAIDGHHITVDDLVAEGDRVVTRWTVTGKQRADMPGIPNHGKRFTVDGITISRVAEGRIAEQWQVWDDAGLTRQLS